MTQPNIIFIVLDALRADKMTLTENDNYLTPFMKSLLINSIYFANCISNSPWTVPSHMSMFTGLYHTQIKLVNKNKEKLSDKIPILAEILKETGYNTICFSENPYISKIYGLTRGFEKIFNVSDWNPWIREDFKMSILIKILEKLDFFFKNKFRFKTFLKVWPHLKKRCEKIIKSIIKKLFLNEIIFKLKNDTIKDLEELSKTLKNNNKEKPLFLFFNFLTTHDPYIPLIRTFKKFNLSINDFKIIKDMIIFKLETLLDINIKSKRLNDDMIKAIAKLYDACVFSSDIVVKHLFSILNKCNLLDNSYIIITSDHGEHLGSNLDHYLWEHNTYLSVYKSLNKVPLLIFNKNFTKTIINDQVQLKDLFHTILHITGIPPNKNKYLELEKSIMYQINNGAMPKYIFGEYLKQKKNMLDLINSYRNTINKHLIPTIFNHLYFLRSNNYKIISYDNLDKDEFYDIINDPDEKLNIIDKDVENYKKMKLFLLNFLKKINDLKEIKDFITEKEKDSVKRSIAQLKIKGI